MYATLGLTRWKVAILRRSSSVRLVGAPSPSELEEPWPANDSSRSMRSRFSRQSRKSTPRSERSRFSSATDSTESPDGAAAVIMGATTTALGLRHHGRRAAVVGITRRLSSMLGEPRGDEGAATAMDERAKGEWSPFEPTRRVVMAGCRFAEWQDSLTAIHRQHLAFFTRSCLM